jgi:release factor glutamine methyltransferase
MITVLEVIKLSTEYLQKKGVESPRVNAEILLAEILKCKRLDLYLAFDKPLAEKELSDYREAIRKRGLRIPLQYIVGSVEFYGLKILVNENVLIPRPETELLVEKIINEAEKSVNIKILDIGVGSGNISISILKNLPNANVVAIDISELSLKVAKQNAELNSLQDRIDFKLCDIMNDSLNDLGKFDIIVSNPPYVSETDFDNLEPELKMFEPKIALTDNSNGISFYKKIIEVSDKILKKPGKLFFELGMGQSMQVKTLFEQKGFSNINISKDYSGTDRIISGELR